MQLKSATSESLFQSLLHQALALAAPAESLAALRGWLEETLAKPQDTDRPATFAAAEALGGLVASGAPFAGAWSALTCMPTTRLSETQYSFLELKHLKF